MREETLDKLIDLFSPKKETTALEWMEENIYIPHDYPSPYKGKFKNLFPFWQELIECADDNSINEIIVQKSSQSGCSQIMLSIMLYLMARKPAPAMYITSSVDMSEEYKQERIDPLFKNTDEIKQLYANGKSKGQAVYLPNGSSLIAINNNSISQLKSRAIKYIYADELDTFQDNSLDKIRARQIQYQNLGSKLIAISTPDITPRKNRNSNESPIALEIEKTDKRRFYLEIEKGKPFYLQWTIKQGEKIIGGIIWDDKAKNEDGTWNYSKVKQSLRYKNEYGDTYTEEQIKKAINKGKWIATNPDADPSKRGYLINGLYHQSWKELVSKFLDAKKSGGIALRTFFAENLGEITYTEKIEVGLDLLTNLERNYNKGESPFKSIEPKNIKRVLTFDVQKRYLIYLICDVIRGGEVAIVDWGTTQTFSNINEISNKFKCNAVIGDSGYALRRNELLQACWRYNFIACFGSSKKDFNLIFKRHYRDPFEGTSKQGKNSVLEIEWQTDIGKHDIFERYQTGEKLQIYQAPERELILQLTSEKYQDNAWIKIRDNHLFDCLNMVILYGILSGLSSTVLNEGL